VTDDWWEDAFAEDEAARERERRRAERAARRRERQRALADRVREERESQAPPAPAEPTVGAGPVAPPAAPRRARPPDHPPPEILWRRRALGIALLAASVALVAFGAITLADRIGGGDDSGPAAAPKLGTVTIPEGLDREQIAEVAKKAGARGDYMKASRSFKGFDPGRYGAQNPESLEGFLFPATYELPRKPTADDLIGRQLDAFSDRIKRIDMSYAKSKNLTVYDVVIIASMIEREVQVPAEREKVAAVIYNRLHAGMPLAIDATIRYEDQNFDQPLTESRLEQNTPYNTRTNTGLPPGPIGNPGEASLRAAANPAKVDYLYYVVKPGTCGHVFTADEAEFERAAAAYQKALEEQGGSPTEC
jgi:YceG-like family